MGKTLSLHTSNELSDCVSASRELNDRAELNTRGLGFQFTTMLDEEKSNHR
jgi:hypothetical protein